MDVHGFVYLTTVLLGIAVLTTSLSTRLGVGAIIGFIAAGIVVGPSVLDLSSQGDQLREFAELGVVLLLFTIGLEMEPSKLWSMRRLVFGLGALQVVVTGLVLAGFLGAVGSPWNAALVGGLGLALSSTAFVLPILGERGEMKTPHGKATFSVLLFQDLAIVPLLALVPLLAVTTATHKTESGEEFLFAIGEASLAVLAIVLIGRFVLPKLLDILTKHRNRKAFVGLVMFAVFGSAYLTDTVGLSMALGTFLIGMLLSASEYRHQIEAIVAPFKGSLLSLFFIAVGMSMDLNLLVQDPLGIVVVALLLIVAKVAVLFGISLLFGLGKATSARVAVLLGQSGEFGFVLFGVALSTGIMYDAGFNRAVLIISVTMMLTPFLARISDWAGRKFDPVKTTVDLSKEHREATPPQEENHVILAGYGRVGTTIGRMLTEAKVPFIAFDLDPKRVQRAREKGLNVFYGDVGDEHVLASGGIGRASCLVITAEDPHSTEKILEASHNCYSTLRVFARARFLSEADDFVKAGATLALPDTLESSLRLGEIILEAVGTRPEEANRITRFFRDNGYQELRAVPGVQPAKKG